MPFAQLLGRGASRHKDGEVRAACQPVTQRQCVLGRWVPGPQVSSQGGLWAKIPPEALRRDLRPCEAWR